MPFITTTICFCLLSFVHPKSLTQQLTQQGGNPKCFNQNTACHVEFPFFVPFVPLVGPWVPGTLQPLTEAEQAQSRVTCWRERLTTRNSSKELELQLPRDKMAILKGTKFNKLSLISRLLMPFHQQFLGWQDPHVGVGLRWSQGKSFLIFSSGIAE